MERKYISRLAVGAAVTCLTLAPVVAHADDHKAAYDGVIAHSNGSVVRVVKTEDNGKGAFARYVSGGSQRDSQVTSIIGNDVVVDTKANVTAVSACLSNGWLPSSCSAPNNKF